MDKTEALILIVGKIFHALDLNEQTNVKNAIRKELKNLNEDLKTSGTKGAVELAELAKKITKDEYLIGNGFD